MLTLSTCGGCSRRWFVTRMTLVNVTGKEVTGFRRRWSTIAYVAVIIEEASMRGKASESAHTRTSHGTNTGQIRQQLNRSFTFVQTGLHSAGTCTVCRQYLLSRERTESAIIHCKMQMHHSKNRDLSIRDLSRERAAPR